MKVFTLFFACFLTAFFWTNNACAQGNTLALQIIPDTDTLYVCTGEEVGLAATGATTYRWVPADIFDDPTIAAPRVVNLTQDTWVVVESVINGVIEFDSIFLNVIDPVVQIASAAEDPLCRGDIVTLTAENNVQDQGLSWSPTESLRAEPNAGTVRVQPESTTTYTARLDIQGCVAQATFTVDVRSEVVTINNPDTVFLCQGEETQITAQTFDGTNNNFRWFTGLNEIPSNDLSLTVSPPESITLYAELTTPECIILDSVFIQIDSLPDNLDITADPDKEAYCFGDLVTLTSPTYEPSEYPAITHQWVSVPAGGGFETPDTLYNMVFTAQDSALFQRTSINNGCRDSTQIFIPVIPPKMIAITPQDPVLCPGESVQLMADFEGEGDIEWMPQEGLSCTDCPDPVATPLMAMSTFTITVTEMDCPSSQNVTVELLPPPIVLNGNLQVCAGESIPLAANASPQASFEWREAGNPDVLSTDPFFAPTPSESTTYTVTAQYPDCEPIIAEAAVQVVPQPELTVSDDQLLCPGDTLMIQAQSSLPAGIQETFQWTANGETFSESTLTVSPAENTVYDLIYLYGPGCTPLQEEVVVSVLDAPVIEEISVNPESAQTEGLPLGESVGLRVITDPEEPTNVTYQWSANGETIGTGTEIEDQPSTNPTTYQVDITTAQGCTVSREISIAVTEPRYQIPNAFSPNGDNVNDFFNLVFVGAIDITDFRIYNRWGNLVYDNDTPETGWDGTVDGEPAPSDVYIYRMSLRFPDGRAFTEQGEVTLIR